MKAEALKGSVRPVITLMLVAVCSVMVGLQITVPEWFQALTIGSVGYWYGERKTK